MRLPNRWLIFILVAIAQFMVVLDVSIINVALPEIKDTLGFTDSSLQWMITAYALAFGGFLLLGGRIADLYGRKRTVLTGIVGFSLFSLIIGLSDNGLMTIILRGLQGLSAALMSPAALSIVLSTFHDKKERVQALSYWAIMGPVGAAAGLIIGGALTQFVNWHWNFFINVPIGVLIFIGISKFVANDSKQADRQHLDIVGAATVTSGLAALVAAISQISVWGLFSLPTIGLLLLAVILLVLFFRNESTHKKPLMPLSFFKLPNIIGANLTMMLFFSGQLGMFYLLSLYFQNIAGLDPFPTGLSILPFPIVAVTMIQFVPKLIEKFNFRPLLLVGPVIMASGLLLLSRIPMHPNYLLDILPSMILMPIGVGLTLTSVITAATVGAPDNESGLASGLINTSQQLGGALGLSILAGVSAVGSSALVGLHNGFITAAILSLIALVSVIFGIKKVA